MKFLSANRVRGLRAVVALLVLVGLGATACSTDPVPLTEEVTRQLDIPNEVIAVTGVEGGELTRRMELVSAIAKAQVLGTEMRIVISGPEDDLVQAQAVVERYGGTALTYKLGSGDERTQMTSASRNMNGDQLDRAQSAAEQDGSIGGSAGAFVKLLEDEGIRKGGTSAGRWLVYLLLALAVLFVLSQLRAYLRARKRARRRRADFARRRDVLRDWASQLEPQVAEVRSQQARLDSGGATALQESATFVAGVVPTIDTATSLSELDAAEIRIARTAIKLRNLRQDLAN